VGTEQQLVPHPTIVAGNSGATSGWDPYEVWRTRVFLPRLAGEERARLSLAPVATLCVVPEARTNDEPSDGARDRSPDDGEALRQELIDVIGSLYLAGLTSILLNYSDRLPPRYSRRPRGVSPTTLP